MIITIPGVLLWNPVLDKWIVMVGDESSPLPVREVFDSGILQQQLTRAGIAARVAGDERGGHSLYLRNASYQDQARLLAFLQQYYPNHPTRGHRIDWAVGPMIQV